MNKKAFGRRITEARKKERMTAEYLAELVERSEKTIRGIECGSKATTIDVLIRLCNILKVSPDYLLAADLDGGENQEQNRLTKASRLMESLTDNELDLIITMLEVTINKRRSKNKENNYK